MVSHEVGVKLSVTAALSSEGLTGEGLLLYSLTQLGTAFIFLWIQFLTNYSFFGHADLFIGHFTVWSLTSLGISKCEM